LKCLYGLKAKLSGNLSTPNLLSKFVYLRAHALNRLILLKIVSNLGQRIPNFVEPFLDFLA
jgi:hypothetical protein